MSTHSAFILYMQLKAEVIKGAVQQFFKTLQYISLRQRILNI